MICDLRVRSLFILEATYTIRTFCLSSAVVASMQPRRYDLARKGTKRTTLRACACSQSCTSIQSHSARIARRNRSICIFIRVLRATTTCMHIASLDELIGMGLSLSFRSLAAYACGAIFNAAAAAAAAAGRKRASERERSLSVRPVRPYSPPVRVLQ